jgi:hypothetical protein
VSQKRDAEILLNPELDLKRHKQLQLRSAKEAERAKKRARFRAEVLLNPSLDQALHAIIIAEREDELYDASVLRQPELDPVHHKWLLKHKEEDRVDPNPGR